MVKNRLSFLWRESPGGLHHHQQRDEERFDSESIYVYLLYFYFNCYKLSVLLIITEKTDAAGLMIGQTFI